VLIQDANHAQLQAADLATTHISRSPGNRCRSPTRKPTPTSTLQTLRQSGGKASLHR